MKKRVAVILCGSGYKDGSEIRESVGLLWALSVKEAEVSIFALDELQRETTNCLTGKSIDQERNQLIESARIARGNISKLDDLNPDSFDCLMLPGGFGAAKNLCDFASAQEKTIVHPKVEKIIQAFHQSQKPIGAICIAPVIVAAALKEVRLRLTLGKESETTKVIESWGHYHVETPTSECLVDRWSKIVTTPAYMDDEAKLSEIFQGISSMVKECLALI
ncbi:MAG: isoprenoid biosynthesis glyoxalase ElbB [Bacteriovoracaceae bacterium]